MAVHAEQLIDALIAHLQSNFSTQLASVLSDTDTKLQLWAPRAESYFIGDPARYRGYQVPAVFFRAARVTRPLEGTAGDWGHVRYQHHGIGVTVVVEDSNEEKLERKCWRVADVLDACLHDQEVYAPTVATRSCKVFVPEVRWGRTLVSTQADSGVFRKTVVAELLVKHWDSTSTMAPSPGGTGPTTSSTSSIVASASDTLLTSTSATEVVAYATDTDGGNFIVHLYYRVVTGTTDATITITWQDGTGSQSVTAASGSQLVGSYTVAPAFINAVGGSQIVISATAGTANQVYVSAAIEAL